MNYKVLVNKNHPIKEGYKVEELVSVASAYKDNIQLDKLTYDQFLKFKEDAKNNHIEIDIMSGYRTYNYQEKLFNNLVTKKGYNYAYKYIAPPGRSEHETGLALDFVIYKDNKCYIEHEVEDLEELKWIHQNAHKYGFILRYPPDKEEITNYNYEPWHLRYVGNLAIILYSQGITLEEYYHET